MKTDTQTHTPECLHNGDASACPKCKPINDRAAFARAALDEALRYKRQAGKLAEALRDALKYADSATEHPENKAAFRRIITTTLAEYESEVQHV